MLTNHKNPLFDYGKDYCQKYEEYSNSELGRKIYSTRWALIEKYCHGDMTLLDWGCAGGAFHLSSVNGFRCGGYDVNPCSPFSEQPGLGKRDILTMWDSIEHMTDISSPFIYSPDWVFISTPNLESVKVPIKEWKHYRPFEHIHYFDKYSLESMLAPLGYVPVEFNYDEGALRDPKNPEAILTAVFQKKR